MVSKDYFNKYLKDRYKDQVKWYDNKSIHNQNWAKGYQVTIIIFAAITPILAALELKWPTIVSSAFVAAMVGILKYCKFEDLWHNYRTTCETLKKEKVMYDSKTGPYESVPNVQKLFIERVESLISKENTAWSQIVSREEQKDKQG